MRTLVAGLGLFIVIGAATAQPVDPAAPTVRYTKDARFEDVRDDARLAIESRGLVIDLTSHIHQMLERTGKDLGRSAKIFRNAETFSFCSATLSRQVLEADPHLIAHCPYSVTVYTSDAEPGKVHVAYRRLPVAGSPAAQKALKAVNGLLDGVARTAVGK